jgi:hypothetical protein
MKKQEKKPNTQLIVGSLLAGKTLRAKEVAEIVSDAIGRKVKVNDVTNTLSKISDSKKCDLGYFVKRSKQGTSFVYHMVEEARELSEDQAYGLTLKAGKGKYPLEQALEEFPALQKYVGGNKGAAKKAPAKKAAKKSKPAKPEKKPAAPPKVIQTPMKEAAAEEEVVVLEPSDSEKTDNKLAMSLIQKLVDKGVDINIRFSPLTISVKGKK